MIIKESQIRKIIKEEILLEQSISELIAKVPKKAVVKVMAKAFKSPLVAAKLGKYYLDAETWESLVNFMGEKLKGEQDKFDSEDAVLEYINDNAGELVGFAVEHYNQEHPDDEPVKL